MSEHDYSEASEPVQVQANLSERYTAGQLTNAGMLGFLALGGTMAIIETTPSSQSLTIMAGGIGLRVGGYLMDKYLPQ